MINVNVNINNKSNDHNFFMSLVNFWRPLSSLAIAAGFSSYDVFFMFMMEWAVGDRSASLIGLDAGCLRSASNSSDWSVAGLAICYLIDRKGLFMPSYRLSSVIFSVSYIITLSLYSISFYNSWTLFFFYSKDYFWFPNTKDSFSFCAGSINSVRFLGLFS